MTSGSLASPAALDPDLRRSLRYVPRPARAGLVALWRLDAAFAAVLQAPGQPMIKAIKLAWWREALEGMEGGAVPAQPVLQAIAGSGLPGPRLARIGEGWAALLGDGALAPDAREAYADGRGGTLFACSAELLGCGDWPHATRAGEGWALAKLAGHSSLAEDAKAARDAALARMEGLPRWPRRLRPLGMLWTAARFDIAGTGRSPRPAARRVRMAAHRLNGL